MIRLSIAVAVALLTGCRSDESAADKLLLQVVVLSPPYSTLAGVEILLDGHSVGKTDSDGELSIPIEGQPGRVLRVAHVCPDGHSAPSPFKELRARRYEGASGFTPIRVQLECKPSERTALFAVRAKNAPNIPVLLDGRLVARTNRVGVAHFWASARPGTEFTVGLDATERPQLLPRGTRHPFLMGDSDQVFVVDQVFEIRQFNRGRSRARRRIIKIE